MLNIFVLARISKFFPQIFELAHAEHVKKNLFGGAESEIKIAYGCF
jgi:hypothetical protein